MWHQVLKIPDSQPNIRLRSFKIVKSELHRVISLMIFFLRIPYMNLLPRTKFRGRTASLLSGANHISNLFWQKYHDLPRFGIQISVSIWKISDFRSNSCGCNFAHTCRWLKNPGVPESARSNTLISGVFWPKWPTYPTPRGCPTFPNLRKSQIPDTRRPIDITVRNH